MKNKIWALVMVMVIGLAAVCLLAPAPARGDQSPQSFGCTNTVRSNTTVTACCLGSSLTIDNQDAAGVAIRAQGDAAGTGAITVTFARSHDGTNYETAPKFTVITALNGNTAVFYYTNLSSAVIGACRSVKITSIVNADAGAGATNFAVWLLKKNVAHGK